jgi:hypothetical protein
MGILALISVIDSANINKLGPLLATEWIRSIPRAGNSGTLLARLGLGTATPKSSRFFKNALNRPNFKMTLRKSQRKPKPRTIWEEKKAPSAASDPKITQKTARTVEKTALKPIATGPLSDNIGFDESDLPELPIYRPPLNLQF